MSGGPNQRTLFQTWGASVSQNEALKAGKDARKAGGATRPSSSSRLQVAPTNPPQLKSPWTVIGPSSTDAAEIDCIDPEDEDEDDDDLMVVAVYEAERSLQLENPGSLQNDPATGGNAAHVQASPCGKAYPDLPGFDSSSSGVWIYPTNYPIRDYQLKISEVSLFKNTLVCLPTGLGKTFIASVVMYNFYRWYPAGKIVFMAPTKPLVAQQIEACYKVMGIPQEHMAELTGSIAPKQRQEVWRSKRVFFLTPQVMVNDLSRDSCPAEQIKCVVIDEAHKALGNHAYCQVIRQLTSQTSQFRVLALSATPGGDTKSIQSVISNLLISHIELRSEESPDIQAHSHQRSVEKVVVPLGEKLSAHQARYLQVLEKFMSRLVQNRVMGHKDLRTLSKYQLILARDQFRKNPPPHIKGSHVGVLEGDFALCISLYHGYELLMQMGLRSLFFYIQGIMDGSREMSRAKNELQRTPIFMDLYSEMESMFLKTPDGPFIYSHPKLEKLEEVVLQHFTVWAQSCAETKDGVSTRVMIFSSFRESVQEIATMLNQHAPLIRVMTFMGQASAGKGVKGFTQKEQLEVIHRFRQGGFNTLVSTCVGEEGLDIGEVDLIVCFDAQKNPIRLVQRMGRTGRKRQGRIVVVLAEGREERTYNQSQSNKRSVYKSITSNKNGLHMYPSSPRMLPEGVHPRLHKMHITLDQFGFKEGTRRSVRGRRSHPEGRASLIHPQNLFQQESPTSDGFLSRTEYSLWASTMQLKEHENPTLKRSHFLSIPNDSTPQEENAGDKPASRELSLWEWRHWQHKPLPFHTVDHSLRCHHFIKVMELIDGMRDESEGECCYEQQLLPYLHGEDADKKRQKKPNAPKMRTKKSKCNPSHNTCSALDYISIEAHTENAATAGFNFTFPPEKQRLPGEHLIEGAPSDDTRPEHVDSPSHVSDAADIGKTETDRPAHEIHATNEEHGDFEEMFYLPETYSAPFLPFKKPESSDGLKAVLANVAELLSRSPPSLENIVEVGNAASCLPHSPQPPLQPFPVSFSLEVDDEDVDDVGCEDNSANSPTWDEVFEDKEVGHENIDNHRPERFNSTRAEAAAHSVDADKMEDGAVSNDVQMDDSLDLFEDDEAFMQMTIPDIPTPEDGVTARNVSSGESDGAVGKMAKGEHTDGAANPSDCTKTLVSVKLTEKVAADKTARLCFQSSYDATEEKPQIHTPAKTFIKVSSSERENPQLLDSSRDLFSVNFDLGYSLEDSDKEEEQEEVDAAPAFLSPKKPASSAAADLLAVSNSSTPRFTGPFSESKLSSLQADSQELPSPVTSLGNRRTLFSRFARPASASLNRGRAEGDLTMARVELGSNEEPIVVGECSPNPAEFYSDSEEEAVHHKRRHHKVNPLSSPEMSKILSDGDSPLVVKKKRVSVLNTTDETQAGASSDHDDFQNDSVLIRRKTRPGSGRRRVPQPRVKNTKARQFLDEEAELSGHDDGADVSSDEEDGTDLNRSLEGFVVDNTHLSQGLNGRLCSSRWVSQFFVLSYLLVLLCYTSESEMQGVYLKSVRSPSVQGKFKMSCKTNHNMDVFSQVPEMDETYAEDSFVVGSDEEEPESSEEEPEAVELLPEVSSVDGRKQYATRRRVFLHNARMGPETKSRTQSAAEQRAKPKRSRVVCLKDSSEEETDEVRKKRSPSTAGHVVPLQAIRPHPHPSGQKSSAASTTLASKLSLISKGQRSSLSGEQRNERCRQRLENQHLLSDELDFAEPEPTLITAQELQGVPSTSSALPPASVSILVDSRCLGGGAHLLTSLRQRHAANVHVCSLDGCYFIVSNRMAVERHRQSSLAATQNRKRLVERLNNLQTLFERVCIIVEKDRSKQGEVTRPFQRTRYYDSTIAALVGAGIRLLWSEGAEESAGLLADLAKLEQRKGQGISVPLEVKGQRREQALQLYRSLPSVNHVQALNLLHNFSSISQLMNSSVEAIQKGSCMSRTRAEEIYRCIRRTFDSSRTHRKQENDARTSMETQLPPRPVSHP